MKKFLLFSSFNTTPFLVLMGETLSELHIIIQVIPTNIDVVDSSLQVVEEDLGESGKDTSRLTQNIIRI